MPACAALRALSPGRRQSDLEHSPILGSRQQLDDPYARRFDGVLACRLPRHSERACNVCERRCAAATLDGAQHLPSSAVVQRGLAVERLRFFQCIRRSHDLVKERRRLDVVLAKRRLSGAGVAPGRRGLHGRGSVVALAVLGLVRLGMRVQCFPRRGTRRLSKLVQSTSNLPAADGELAYTLTHHTDKGLA